MSEDSLAPRDDPAGRGDVREADHVDAMGDVSVRDGVGENPATESRVRSTGALAEVAPNEPIHTGQATAAGGGYGVGSADGTSGGSGDGDNPGRGADAPETEWLRAAPGGNAGDEGPRRVTRDAAADAGGGATRMRPDGVERAEETDE